MAARISSTGPQKEAIQADQQDEAELKALETKIKGHPNKQEL